tara:strand:+ start:895 stop:1872 length:978 start_codon:yes stop_codon:yes gene_type:complete
MLIVRAPLRVSFFGGGTDIPEFYNKHGGSVLSCAINKYVYTSLKDLDQSYQENYRLNYSKTEIKNNISEIKNNLIRESLNLLDTKSRLYISTIADVPLKSGLGSSSSFAASLLFALAYKNNIKLNKKNLAELVCKLEIEILKNPIGKQDQYASVYGGINKISFSKRSTSVKKIILSNSFKRQIENSMFLVWTGQQRNANTVLKKQSNDIINKIELYKNMKPIVDEGYTILTRKKFNLIDFSYLLNESWSLKKKFSNKIISDKSDYIFKMAKKNGALGMKVCGAGNGGFTLICAPMECRQSIKKALKGFLTHDIKIDNDGVKRLKI